MNSPGRDGEPGPRENSLGPASPSGGGALARGAALTSVPPGVLCATCDYDIQGTPLDGVCPECGSGVSASIVQRCVGCGYDLQGLRPEGGCPECGTPVERTMRQSLRFGADLAFVKRLRRGLSFLLNGILLYLLVGIGGAVAGVVMQGSLVQPGGGPADATPYIAVQALGGAFGLIALLITLWGFWLFATPDPGDPGGQDDPASRKVLRIATVVHAIAGAINAVAGVVAAFGVAEMMNQMMQAQQGGGSGAPPPTVSFGSSFVVASIVSGLAGLAIYAAIGTMFFSSMLYLRRVALRIPDMKIHRLAKTRMIACPIWATVGILLLFLGPLIALVLYWNLLNMVQKQVKGIVRDRERAGAT